MHPRALLHSAFFPALACAVSVPPQTASPGSVPWQDPTCDKERPETHAIPMSDPGEGPDSWALWMKHHENRILMPDALHPNLEGYRFGAEAMRWTGSVPNGIFELPLNR